MTIKLINAEGNATRTANVEACLAETHIRANDSLASEARCLLAYSEYDGERDPIAWDDESGRLVFADATDSMTPVRVIWE